MRVISHSLFVLLMALVSAQAAAQDAQPSTASADAGSAGNGDDTGSRGGGGFLGIGGQKPLQRVRGIPLPNRSSRPLLASAQSAGSRDANPAFLGRRSKPMIGELTTDFPARMIYLNGKNVSSVRDQQLDGVNVRIDSNGNVHILAPHYEVQESTHYRPLLPNDVPKVSKPVPAVDEPLLSGRHSKAAAPTDSAKPLQATGAVPPVEMDEADQQSASGSGKQPEQSDKSAPIGKEKSATEGQKL